MLRLRMQRERILKLTCLYIFNARYIHTSNFSRQFILSNSRANFRIVLLNHTDPDIVNIDCEGWSIAASSDVRAITRARHKGSIFTPVRAGREGDRERSRRRTRKKGSTIHAQTHIERDGWWKGSRGREKTKCEEARWSEGPPRAHATPYHTMPCHAIPRHAMPRHVMPRHANIAPRRAATRHVNRR